MQSTTVSCPDGGSGRDFSAFLTITGEDDREQPDAPMTYDRTLSVNLYGPESIDTRL